MNSVEEAIRELMHLIQRNQARTSGTLVALGSSTLIEPAMPKEVTGHVQKESPPYSKEQKHVPGEDPDAPPLPYANIATTAITTPAQTAPPWFNLTSEPTIIRRHPHYLYTPSVFSPWGNT